jgi:hypothetical protein
MHPFTKAEKAYQPLSQQELIASDTSNRDNGDMYKPWKHQGSRLAFYLIFEALVFISLFILYKHSAVLQNSGSNFSETCQPP